MQVSEDLLNRAHQSRISFLKDEVEVLKYHLDEQARILEELSETSVFKHQKHDFFNHFQVQALTELSDSIHAKRSSLIHLQVTAEELSKLVRNNILLVFHRSEETNSREI